ncbi:ribosomal protein L19 [Colletotrichum paranaense]|uniref:Ribosomal protein L19 n=8 Tax=Colletotrichum acutatum species complex TaxID=2707335 RepID=A0A9P7UD27_9PEZI|nr:ribosomal protein L19 [Colletotrichum scovillei]XP_060306119.1 ribosomal protein L19 [Colletotrichum costaricense]XP_060342914.1 ribosomal protein L19 [Colletotrichum paranaense]XP_060383478.1 ribosomal protein L19 [Colletotrichum tamarilloi]XP_060402361.1 ribosomal protein L19 [Colletotrichum abscissum]KAI3527761.1 ribosomal protein L19 [Colletotrichum filicis]KAK1462345.1 ribosomal protein L19 [Colletotrichum melonis]KAK1498405.1 ribosomal protein L19 [Colletotrichum cuscutae]KAK170935
MNATSLLRPMGCLKTALRQTRHQRLLARSMATAAAPEPPSSTPSPATPSVKPSYYGPRNKPTFAVYPPLPSIRQTTHKNPLPSLDAAQRTTLDPTGARTRLFDPARPDAAKVGDVLMVTTKSGEPFSGVCMSIRRRGVDTGILLRGQLMKVGVEMWYKIYSPTVIGIDIVWRRPKRARRARLTYLRKPKHDMGNVDHLVFAWKKERYGTRSKGRAGSRF